MRVSRKIEDSTASGLSAACRLVFGSCSAAHSSSQSISDPVIKKLSVCEIQLSLQFSSACSIPQHAALYHIFSKFGLNGNLASLGALEISNA